MAQYPAALKRRRGLALALLCGAALAACSPQPRPEQFAGAWKSSRLTTPLHLHPNGEWEIRTAEGAVLQYGVWQLRDRTFVWSIRQDGGLLHDPNPIVAVKADRFELRERDGSVTVFQRLGPP
jgi:hypothetical protein